MSKFCLSLPFYKVENLPSKIRNNYSSTLHKVCVCVYMMALGAAQEKFHFAFSLSIKLTSDRKISSGWSLHYVSRQAERHLFRNLFAWWENVKRRIVKIMGFFTEVLAFIVFSLGKEDATETCPMSQRYLKILNFSLAPWPCVLVTLGHPEYLFPPLEEALVL